MARSAACRALGADRDAPGARIRSRRVALGGWSRVRLERWRSGACRCGGGPHRHRSGRGACCERIGRCVCSRRCERICWSGVCVLVDHRTRSWCSPGLGGGPWGKTTYDNWRKRAFDRACKAIGLCGARPYDLRHSFASLLLHEGRSVTSVARQLGRMMPGSPWAPTGTS
jgi:integrase